MVHGQGYMVDANFPAKLSQFLPGHQRFVWSGVVMMENDTFTIDQFWPFLVDGCIQFVQLLTVNIRSNRLVPWKQLKIYHTLPIPPNRQHNLFLVDISL